MKQYEQIQAPKKWLKTEEGSRQFTKMQMLGKCWPCETATCEAMQVPEPTAALGWTLVGDGSWAGREGGSSCRAQGLGTAAVPPWITTLSHQVPLFARTHTQHPGHQNRHGLKWLETK